jgi:hypothetical protein
MGLSQGIRRFFGLKEVVGRASGNVFWTRYEKNLQGEYVERRYVTPVTDRSPQEFAADAALPAAWHSWLLGNGDPPSESV